MNLRVWLLAAVHPGSGPEAKMRGLAASFADLGCDVSATLVSPEPLAIRTLRRRLRQPLLGTTAATAPDLIVARSHWSLPPIVPDLRRLRHRHGTRLVIDIPTPTAAGMREVFGSSRPWPDRAARLSVEAAWIPSAWPWADVLVQYDVDGLPWRLIAPGRRLTVTNGVRVADRPLAPEWVNRSSMAFVAAGSIGQWHGVDRLMRGLASPAAGTGTLTIVGDGPELPRLQSLADDLGLTNRVRFLGPLTGVDYDRELAAADICVASLGEHRRGTFALSPLKTRDYLARGLPVLIAGDDPDLRTTPPFAFRVPADDSTIDCAAVDPWLHRLRAEVRRNPGTEVSPASIRTFAAANLDQTDRARAILAAVHRRPPALA